MGNMDFFFKDLIIVFQYFSSIELLYFLSYNFLCWMNYYNHAEGGKQYTHAGP